MFFDPKGFIPYGGLALIHNETQRALMSLFNESVIRHADLVGGKHNVLQWIETDNFCIWVYRTDGGFLGLDMWKHANAVARDLELQTTFPMPV